MGRRAVGALVRSVPIARRPLMPRAQRVRRARGASGLRTRKQLVVG